MMNTKTLLFIFTLFTSLISSSQICSNTIPVTNSQSQYDSFESGLTTWSNPTVSNFPSNWTVFAFSLQQGPPQGGSSLPSGASDGSNYVFIRNTSSSPNFSGELISSCFDLTNTIYPTLTFDTYKLNNDGLEAVYVSTDLGNTWNILSSVSQSVYGSIPNQWTTRQVDLKLYSGFTNLKIRITGILETDIVAFDNIKFEDNRICPAAGTPCDDYNPATQNDIADGNCGCSGTQTSCTNNIINTEDFETNGIYSWNAFGGTLLLTNYIDFGPQGKGHARIRPNTTFSGIETANTYNLSNYQDVTISFLYYPQSFGNNESFSLMISNDGGLSYTVSETWTNGVDFQDYSGGYPFNVPNGYDLIGTNRNEIGSAVISGPFTTNTKFMIRSNSGNMEFLVDDIRIQGYESNCPALGTPCDDNDPTTQNDVEDGNCGCAGTPIPSCITTLIDDNDFETGWTIWNDGGRDSGRRRNSNYSNSGLRSVLIRDNTNSSKITTDALDLTSFTDATIDFTYITEGFNNVNEDFFLEISYDNGVNFSVLEQWNYSDEFQNNSRQFDAVTMVGPFTSTMKFRFRCDASTDANQVYIDDIVITGCLQTCPAAGTPCDDNDPTTQNDIEDGNCGCTGTPIPSCTDNVVFTEGFENGIGTWVTSGFTRIFDPSNNGGGFFYTPGSGLAHLYLRNAGAAIKSQSFDLSNYQDVEISFKYLTRSLTTGENFEVYLSDNGGTFNSIGSWTFGNEITANEIIRTATAQLQGPFSSNVKFRIVHNSNGSVEIDDIIIEGCENNAISNRLVSNIINDKVIDVSDDTFYIFPNPAADLININISNTKLGSGELTIVDFLGKTVLKQSISANEQSSSLKFDVSNLNSGIYFVSLTLNGHKYIKKFIVK